LFVGIVGFQEGKKAIKNVPHLQRKSDATPNQGLVSIVTVTAAMEEGRLATTGPFAVATGPC